MNKHILIAEDDTFLAEMMGKVLEQHGMRVTIAHDGQKALEAMENEMPDLLLLDLLMPVLDGHGVMQAMKERHMQCLVMVVSNISDKATRDVCKEYNVKEYFVKSDMDDDALWPAISKYLS